MRVECSIEPAANVGQSDSHRRSKYYKSAWGPDNKGEGVWPRRKGATHCRPIFRLCATRFRSAISWSAMQSPEFGTGSYVPAGMAHFSRPVALPTPVEAANTKKGGFFHNLFHRKDRRTPQTARSWRRRKPRFSGFCSKAGGNVKTARAFLCPGGLFRSSGRFVGNQPKAALLGLLSDIR